MTSSRLLLGIVVLCSFRCVSPMNVIVQWNQVGVNATIATHVSSLTGNRVMAMMHAAMLDALYDLGCPMKSSYCTPPASTVAVSTAAHRVLSALYVTETAAFDASLRAVTSSIGADQREALRVGSDVGDRAGLKAVTSRSNDRSMSIVTYAIDSTAGHWQPTPSDYVQTPTQPHYGDVRPFILKSISTFVPPGPPAFDSAEYKRDWNEVFWYGSVRSANRTADGTEQAVFWDEQPAGVVWNAAAADVIAGVKRSDDLVGFAEAFMLFTAARIDAGIACWATKYKYNTWRPVTAIRQGVPSLPSLVRDATWTPLISTPSFPEYNSAHSAYSAASARILTLIAGKDNFPFTGSFGTGAQRRVRSFKSLWDAAEDAGQSRINGGIHFQFANRDSLELGKRVADAVFEEWRLHGGPSAAAGAIRMSVTLLAVSFVSCILTT